MSDKSVRLWVVETCEHGLIGSHANVPECPGGSRVEVLPEWLAEERYETEHRGVVYRDWDELRFGFRKKLVRREVAVIAAVVKAAARWKRMSENEQAIEPIRVTGDQSVTIEDCSIDS